MLELRRAGYSHLNPDGVRRELERTVREWEASPPQLLHSYISPLFTLGCAVAALIILAVIVYFVWPLLFYLLG